MSLTNSLHRTHCTTETNLKKQGMLPLTFANPADYDTIDPTDVLALPKLATELKPGSKITCEITKADGKKKTIMLNQTFNDNQITWYKVSIHTSLFKDKMNLTLLLQHGSALNAMRAISGL